jgi:hypothetical protein
VEVFVRGDDGRLRTLAQLEAGGAWSAAWGDLEGDVTAPPAVARQNGLLQILVPGRDQTLFHRGQTPSGWSPYEPLDGTFTPY